MTPGTVLEPRLSYQHRSRGGHVQCPALGSHTPGLAKKQMLHFATENLDITGRLCVYTAD